MEELLTVTQMSEELNVTTRTIRNYLAEGKLEGKKIGGQWRFPKSELYKLTGEIGITSDTESLLDNLSEEEYTGIMILNVPIKTIEEIESLKRDILNQYNQVYEGKTRKLVYEVASSKSAKVIIQGPNEYLESFGQWLLQKIKDYKQG